MKTDKKRFGFLSFPTSFHTEGKGHGNQRDESPSLSFLKFRLYYSFEDFPKRKSKEETMSEVILNASNFEEEVLNSKEPVLVDFFATWCGPCKMIAPFIAQLADKYEGRMKVCKANVDEVPDIASSYGVSSIPTLIIFKDGEIAAQRIGGANLAVLDAFIMDNLQ